MNQLELTKILVIEDNEEIRESTSEILQLAGYNVQTASDGKEGVEKANTYEPDLILCDIMMPEMDGYGVLYLLSKNEKTQGTPFIFLSAKADKSDIRKGMELGADDYLTKPFDDVELLKAIEGRLKKRSLLEKSLSKGLEGYKQFAAELRGIENFSEVFLNNKYKSFKKKQTVYNEGDYAIGLFMVTSGKVKTYLLNEDGKELITGIHGEGDFFGYLALMQDSSQVDCAEALEESEITIISKEEFLKLIYRHPDISKKFIELLSQSVKEKEQQLMSIAYNSVRKRVADALIKLFKHHPKSEDSIYVSREDLSNIVGTATETISRTLSDFKSEGLIDLKGGSITIKNHIKLENMLN